MSADIAIVHYAPPARSFSLRAWCGTKFAVQGTAEKARVTCGRCLTKMARLARRADTTRRR